MKLIQIVFQFQYADAIKAIMIEHGNDCCFVRYPMVVGKDRDGQHEGTKVFPGQMSVIQALVNEDSLDELLESLRAFREEKPAHQHVDAFVLPVESIL